MTILKHRNFDFEAHVAGDIPGYMRKQTGLYFEELQDVLQYHGIVRGEKKKELFLQTNIFVFPTLSEAQPVVLLEAMATANIILATNVGGIPDIFVNGKNGFTIDTNNPSQIADTIMKIYENSTNQELNAILIKNHYEVKQKYTEKKFFENLYNILMDTN